jgi:hypothetical protein
VPKPDISNVNALQAMTAPEGAIGREPRLCDRKDGSSDRVVRPNYIGRKVPRSIRETRHVLRASGADVLVDCCRLDTCAETAKGVTH